MSINLSKQKREKMLNTITKIKENIDDDEMLKNLSLIEYELTKKKYGLLWEEHEERVDEELKTKIPIFKEVKEKQIISNKNAKFNFLIEGDNLHSLYLLEKTHKSRVDVIYIDPPYNTGAKDFIYDDKRIDLEDGYRHSKWISFMYKRLKVAKKLLSTDGIIFISIDDNEQAQLRLICDDIFGEENFVGNIVWEKRTKCQNTKTARYMLQSKTESIYVYKNKPEKYEFCLKYESERKYPSVDENGKKYRLEKLGEMSASGMRGRETMIFPIDGIMPKEGNQWKFGKDTIERYRERGDLVIKNKKVFFKIRPEDEEPKMQPFWSLLLKNIGTAESAKSELNEILGTKDHGFETVKPINLIKELLYHVVGNKKNAIILDFFAGSGTTAHAVMELNRSDGGNRQFIICTNNENNICENITYKRIYNAIKGYGKNEPLKSNLKYYETGYVCRVNTEDENIQENLLVDIKNLIQLENGIDIDDKKIKIILNEEKIDQFSANIDEVKKCEKLYISSDILLTAKQTKLFKDNNIEIFTIPEYYFDEEIKEVQ